MRKYKIKVLAGLVSWAYRWPSSHSALNCLFCEHTHIPLMLSKFPLLIRTSMILCESLSHVRLFATPQTIDHQASLSMGFSRQEYWSRLSCPLPAHLPNPGIEPMSLMSPELVGESFTTGATWEAHINYIYMYNICIYICIYTQKCKHLMICWSIQLHSVQH